MQTPYSDIKGVLESITDDDEKTAFVDTLAELRAYGEKDSHMEDLQIVLNKLVDQGVKVSDSVELLTWIKANEGRMGVVMPDDIFYLFFLEEDEEEEDYPEPVDSPLMFPISHTSFTVSMGTSVSWSLPQATGGNAMGGVQYGIEPDLPEGLKLSSNLVERRNPTIHGVAHEYTAGPKLFNVVARDSEGRIAKLPVSINIIGFDVTKAPKVPRDNSWPIPRPTPWMLPVEKRGPDWVNPLDRPSPCLLYTSPSPRDS